MNRQALRSLLFTITVIVSAPMASAHEYYALGFKLIHPWAEASLPDATEAAVYFKLENVMAADRLLRASTPYAESVELRAATAGNASWAVATLEVLPADAVDFAQGGQHLLMRGLKAPLEWGRSYLMTMVFEKAGPILVMVSVGAH